MHISDKLFLEFFSQIFIIFFPKDFTRLSNVIDSTNSRPIINPCKGTLAIQRRRKQFALYPIFLSIMQK